MVVARDQQNAAVLARTGMIGMFEHVAAAIDARTLAIPHGIDAIDPCATYEVYLLRSPHRRRGKVFVDARLEANIVSFEFFRSAAKGFVQTTQRGPAVPADEAS